MRLLILAFFSLMATGGCSDEAEIIGDKPLPVFSEPMQKAANDIADAWGALDHMLFLSDYWPCPLNNGSINLTA